MAHLMDMAPQRGRSLFACLAAFVLVAIFYTSFSGSFAASSHYTSPIEYETSPPPFTRGDKLYGKQFRGRSSSERNRVTNDTLGFEKVFVIGLPERSDKRDALSLTAALTGFHVEWVDGVKEDTIADKAVPFGIDRHNGFGSNLGSWRGHMNAIRRVVEEDLDSALIMEDDMDWDVRLRSQLEDVAQGSRMLLDSKAGARPYSPYGDGWDVLWLGHCGEPFPEDLEENRNKPADHPGLAYMRAKKYAIENDVTVPPPEHTTGLLDFAAHPRTRFVHISAGPMCSFAYAVSQAGARKLLFELSVNHLTGPFDNALADLCRRAVSSIGEESPNAGDRGLDTKCISVTPPVFFHHRARGRIFGDSDIQTVESSDVREKGTTENIMWSARNNIRNMIMDTEMESQY